MKATINRLKKVLHNIHITSRANPINFRLTPFRILYHFFFKGIAKQLKLHEVFEIQSKIIQLVILIERYMIFSHISWNHFHTFYEIFVTSI